LGRELTDEEKNDVIVWEKCRDLSHFVEGFPHEWKLMREMLLSQVIDVRNQWNSLLMKSPSPELNIEIMHAKANGACEAISNFIASVDNAPDLAREVPSIIKNSIEVLRAAPQEV